MDGEYDHNIFLKITVHLKENLFDGHKLRLTKVFIDLSQIVHGVGVGKLKPENEKLNKEHKRENMLRKEPKEKYIQNPLVCSMNGRYYANCCITQSHQIGRCANHALSDLHVREHSEPYSLMSHSGLIM